MDDHDAVKKCDIVGGLRGLGVQAGHVLLVHSSLSAFGHVVGGAETVIEALLEAVGPGGTVAVPTHTWDRIKPGNPVFDYRSTPGCVGTIPETFRARDDALRGLHPTHSCAAIGPHAEDLLRDHETQITPCGSKSPYQRLMDMGGKLVFLGVTLKYNTTFHALEEMACAPYVVDLFQMYYTVDREGERQPVPSRLHGEGVSRDFEGMEPVLLRTGAMIKGTIGRATVRVADAARMRDTIMPMLAEDPYTFLTPESAERERSRFARSR